MKIAFACDHGGFILRKPILEFLLASGHEIIDCGPKTEDLTDDFPPFAQEVCCTLLHGGAERGVLVCGTGIGISIAANRFDHIRAFVSYSPEIAKISREHNDTNVICFGGRTMKVEDVLASLEIFLMEPFIGGKYEKRNEMIDEDIKCCIDEHGKSFRTQEPCCAYDNK